MGHHDEVADGQLSFFDAEEIPLPPDTELSYEKRTGQIAKDVFDSWYQSWYVGRYTQNVAHIMKVFKAGIRAGVNADDLFWAANILGKEKRQITEFSMQWALAQVFKQKERDIAAVDITDRADNKAYGEGFE